MGIWQAIIPGAILLFFFGIYVWYRMEEARNARMKARAPYDAGVQAAMRIQAKARELEQQIYTEAMRLHNVPERAEDDP